MFYASFLYHHPHTHPLLHRHQLNHPHPLPHCPQTDRLRPFAGNPLEEKHSADGDWRDQAIRRLPRLKKLDGENSLILRKGTGDRNLGVIGARSLWEEGEERAGDGIPKWMGARRNRKQILQHYVIFHCRKSTQRWEPLTKGVGTGSTSYGKREVQTPCPPPPYHYFMQNGQK